VSFTRASLTVSKDRAVVAFKHVHDDWRRRLVVNVALVCVVAVNMIECELLRCLVAKGFLKHDLTSSLVDVDDLSVTLLDLFIIDGSATDRDLHCLVFLGELWVTTTSFSFAFNHSCLLLC